MRLLVFLFTMLALAACAEMRYAQEGKTARDTEQDVFVCENQVLAENKGLRGLSDKEIQDLQDECMKSKGYRVSR